MPITLLVVDDDAVDREAVRRNLRQARVDATVIEAAGADEAIALLHRADCVLLDLRLPGEDGRVVLRRIRAQHLTIPVIVLTGQGDEQTAVELMKAGAADYLAKQSLTPDRLERSLRYALHNADVERERRDLLAREQTARQEAQQANRAKDEFLATLSHELRTPLNAILGWTRLLADGQLDAAMTRRGLDTIERNVRVQVKLIDDLLDISRIVAGKLMIEQQPLRLSSVVEAALASQRPSLESAGLTLVTTTRGDERPVAGDATRLQQVVSNLLSNAIKFTPRGGRIDVDLAFEEPRAALTIRDTGVGISADFLPHVFERFRQADASVTRKQGGLGIGLAIVQHLVQAHGGTITATSGGTGQGATFRVELPTVAASTTSPEDSSPAARALGGLSILLVDDDTDSREMTAEFLRRAGGTVATAANAREALAAARSARFDVLVSDIAMPDVNGYTLLQELRANGGAPSAAIALTAHASSDERDRSLTAGFQEHLPKPCEPADIVAAVAAVVEGARSRSGQ